MTIAITGAGGQVGSHLCRELGGAAVGLDRQACNLTDPNSVRSSLLRVRPRLVINAAAYSQVDRAETDQQSCWAVNADGVGNLVEVCRVLDCPLIHISSDYVFGADAGRTTPYREQDRPGPQGVYAHSKLAGERQAAAWPKHFIVRSCGLYGAPGLNKASFVNTMLRLSDERDTLRVVDDQYCTPTYVPHLVQALLHLAQTDAYGTYHVVNSGQATWYDFAAAIFREIGRTIHLERITTTQYAAAAPRPRYSVLDTTKYQRLGGPAMPAWDEALRECLAGWGGEAKGQK